MKTNIKFENAQKLKEQHPDTFYAPDREELERLQPGDFVKICTDNERFWAEVISLKDNIVTARVDNDLLTEELKYNETIEFHLDSVYDILPKTERQPSLKAQTKPVKKPKAKGRRL